MAKFNVRDASKYGGQGGAGYFSLKNDRDTAKVRFLFDSADDLNGYAVHQIEVDGKKRYVNCLHEYGQPKDDCPFCKAGKFVMGKYFIPVYNIAEDRVQTWERGKTWGDRFVSICARNPHLMTHGFEIERIGKPGDTKTSYEIWADPENDDPNVRLEDFEIQDPLGTIILDKSYDDMEYYLEVGSFPTEDDRPVTRRQPVEDERPTRRSPSVRDRF